MKRFSLFGLGIVLLGGFTVNAQIPQPRLWTLFPAGGERGLSTEVKIGGVDLDGVAELAFSDPRLAARPKKNAEGEAIPNEFVVTPDSELTPGLYEAWAVGPLGVSNSRIFVVGSQEETVDRVPSHSMESAVPLPMDATVNGRTVANQKNFYRLFARKGQRITIRCYGESIDSRLEPVLEVFDEQGRTLKRARTGRALYVSPKSTGPLFVSVNDLTYRGGEPFFYRLSAHSGSNPEYVLPLSGQAGRLTEFHVFGHNLPNSSRSDMTEAQGAVLDYLRSTWALPEEPGNETPMHATRPSRWGSRGLPGILFTALRSGNGIPGSRIRLSPFATVVEEELVEEARGPQPITVPISVSGMFYPRYDEDHYDFDAKKGERYWIDLWSSRLGYETSPIIIVEQINRSEDGTETLKPIAEFAKPTRNLSERAFPVYSRDPQGLLTVKDDGRYRVTVADLFNVSQDVPGRIYELQIRPPSPRVRGFSVAQSTLHRNIARRAPVEALAMSPGQILPLRIKLDRVDGFNQAVTVGTETPMEGLTVHPLTIPGNQHDGVLLIEAADEASPIEGALGLEMTLEGEELPTALLHGQVLWEVGDYNNDPVLTRISPHRRVSVSGKQPFPVRLVADRGERDLWETSVAGQLEIPFKIKRLEGFPEAYTFKVKGLKALEKHEGLKVAKDAEVGSLVLDLTKTALPEGIHEFYLSGEVKGKYTREGQKDAKDVTLSTYSAPVLIKVHPAPFEIVLETDASELVRGEVLSIPVKLERRFGFDGQIEVSTEFVGAGEGLETSSSMLRNDEFTLTVRSVEKMPGEKIQIKLRALGKLNGKAVETAKTLTVQLTDRG